MYFLEFLFDYVESMHKLFLLYNFFIDGFEIRDFEAA